ncbi:MAG: DUF4388 domain-containing protein [Acidobacteriota bacterium]
MLGRFDRKFFIDFLRDIDEAELSGILRLRQNRSLKALFFESGYLVFGISNLPDEELGQYLINIGRIPAAHLQSLQSQASRLQPLTKLLILHNLISHEELVQIEYEVISGMAISCFHWEDGEYTFDGSKTADHEFKLQIRASEILIEGIRRMRDESYIHKAIGEMVQIVRPVRNIKARLSRLKLNPMEEFVLSRIDRPQTVSQLIANCGRPDIEILRPLYALLATGVLDPLEEATESLPSTPLPTAPMSAPLPSSPLTTSPLSNPPLPSAPVTRPVTNPIKPSIMPPPLTPPAPTASSPRASGAFQRLSPLDQTYSTLQTAQNQSSNPANTAGISRRPNSKINTAKLEALAGIKIRSSTGPLNSESTERAEQWFMQGKQSLRIGDLRRAELLFRQAAEAAPEKAKYLLALAMLLMKRPAARKEAEGMLLRCCELEPLAIEPRIQLAAIYEQQGLAAKAEQLYKSVLSIDPEHPVASQKVKKEEGSIWKSDMGSLFSKILKK